MHHNTSVAEDDKSVAYAAMQELTKNLSVTNYLGQ
jgi:hypothetical protein